VSSWFPPRPGGVGRVVYDLSYALSRHGVEVHLIVPSGGVQDEENNGDVKIHRVGGGPQGVKGFASFCWNSYRKILRVCKDFDIDVVHGQIADGVLWSLRRNRPYVVTIHGVIADELGRVGDFRSFRYLRKMFGYPILARLEKLNADNSDIVTTVSGYSKEMIAKHYRILPRKIRLIPNGVKVEPFDLPRDGVNEKQTILCVGEITARKGFQFLFLALPHILTVHPDVQLVMIGEGPEKSRLMELSQRLGVQDKVKFLGHVIRESLIQQYERSSVFCLPSLHEACGIVLLEAMVSGKPVVSTSVGGVPEVVKDGETGVLVPPQNVAALAEAINTLLSDDSLRRRLGENAKEYVQRNFSWRNCAQQYIDLYKQVLEGEEGIN